MTTPAQFGNPAEDAPFDLKAFIRKLWGRRWIIIGCTVVFAALGTTAAFVLKPVYRATVVMVTASTEVNGMGGALGSALGQLGGLASLAGINLNSGDGTTEESLAVLRSREFTERFIVDNNLMPKLFASKWDSAAGNWKAGIAEPPTLARAFKRFDSNIRQVVRDKKTGLISLRIEWRDPAEAASWANDLVRRVNAEMRKRAIERSDASIVFLEKELSATTLVGMREALSRLMEAQIKQRMLATVMHEYAFRVVDNAMPADKDDPERPNKLLLIAAGLVAGFLFGVMMVLLRASWSEDEKGYREP